MRTIPTIRATMLAMLLASGCSDKRSELVGPLPVTKPICPATLADRLTITRVGVPADIAYAERGYDGVPKLSRIELAASPDGASVVAWQTADRTAIHVTPLASDFTRSGDDVVVDALELGGVVARDDGFAMLARQPDPGDPLSVDPSEMGTQAAFLMRYRAGAESFRIALTGSTSPSPSLLYTSALAGQLAYNGSKYGAYFAVHAGMGSPMAGAWGDQLSYVDDDGNLLSGGFTWGCSLDTGQRLTAEANGAFAAVCLSDRSPDTGLNWMTEGQTRHLAFEEAWSGYCAGRFGSLVRASDGTHVVVWASRADGGLVAGSTTSHARGMDAPDLALVHVDTGGAPLNAPTWLTRTEAIAEITAHVAPYGKDKYLLVWSTLESCRYDSGNCYGPFGGTFARLIDADGNTLTDDEQLSAWPSDDGGLAIFPNGDIGWAFVDTLPSYTGRLDPSTLPASRTLSIARLRACE